MSPRHGEQAHTATWVGQTQLAEELVMRGISHGAAERELQRRGPRAEGYVSAAPDVPLAVSPRSGAAGLAI